MQSALITTALIAVTNAVKQAATSMGSLDATSESAGYGGQTKTAWDYSIDNFAAVEADIDGFYNSEL